MTDPPTAAAVAELTEQVNRGGVDELDATYAPFSAILTHLVEVTAIYLGPEPRTARVLARPVYVSGKVSPTDHAALVTTDLDEALRDARDRLTSLPAKGDGDWIDDIAAAVSYRAIEEIDRRLARLDQDGAE